MKRLSSDPVELQKIYQARFDDRAAYRNNLWKILTSVYFSRYISAQDAVLDLGCGYGQFINNIRCGKKYAMDLNPRSRSLLNADVRFLEQDCSETWDIPGNSLDVVFTSNFFEHLPTKEALSQTMEEAYRCLRPSGKLIAMGPNIKYLTGTYWDFFDHYTPLTELSLKELLEMRNFGVSHAIGRFLPYTMVNAPPYPDWVISLYLRLTFIWPFFGKQFLLIATKP